MFYNGQRFLAVVAYLYIVNRRERLEEIVAQLVIVFYNQDAMQFVIVFSPEFSGKFQRNGGDIRFIEGLLILNGQSEVLELFFFFGKDDSDSTRGRERLAGVAALLLRCLKVKIYNETGCVLCKMAKR